MTVRARSRGRVGRALALAAAATFGAAAPGLPAPPPDERGAPLDVAAPITAAALLLAASLMRRFRPHPAPSPQDTNPPSPQNADNRPATTHASAHAPVPGGAADGAAATARELARPHGVGVVGPGADGFVRAVLVELLTREPSRTNVVVMRAELDRLFGDGLGEELRYAPDARLHVFDRSEDAAAHLELELLTAAAERANPDLSPTGGRDLPATFWIRAPGPDDAAVPPLARRGLAHGLVTLVNGPWPHGPTRTVERDGGLTGTGRTVPVLTRADALARMRDHLAADR
ncbi:MULTISPECIES: hypothetical protein [Actinomadura]|uniref:Uncharacterized protein n=1 Tax=Actinomadura yumaensis TaxID=111807 RepID=A0ABW2CCW9_9ACTN|nr:hypothetical protein [Actinomadura sp. J1-007]MWK33441.1 hypothetical protein [Actinomadura sp. J1-007]